MKCKLQTNIELTEGMSIIAKRDSDIYKIFTNENDSKYLGDVKSFPLLLLDSYQGEVLSSENLNTNAEKLMYDTQIQLFTSYHLHTHSEYSLQDGAIRMKDLIETYKGAGALTDHGVMYGFLEFYKGMLDANKNPIIGFEAYVSTIYGKQDSSHLILLAENETGVRNLMKLCSEAYDFFYKKPHVSIENLEKYSEGIIATSACIAGEIPKAINKGNLELATETIEKYISIFGKENFFIEIQRHGIENEDAINKELISLARTYGLGIVATADAHYLKEEDAIAQEVLLCLQTGGKMNEPHFKFEGMGYYILSNEEMESLFSDIPEALANTVKIANRCHVELELNNIQMPKFDIPSPFKGKEDYFIHLCTEGFNSRFKGTDMFTDPRYKERLQYEMDMIAQMKFEQYFLIVWDFLNYARSNGIMVGPGRGSAAGSLVAFCLGITDIDPIPLDLLFERFLNPERVSWPDIDSDIEDVRRGEVIEYLTRKYGSENVCNIITFGRMKAKTALADVARTFGYNSSFINELKKYVPNELNMTIDKALSVNTEFNAAYLTNQDIHKVVDVARKLEGIARHSSVHACGFVTSPTAVTDWLPTIMAKNEESGLKEVTSQVTMTEVEELGLLKMDLLGLRTLTIIGDSLKAILKQYGINMKLIDIPLNDRMTYKHLATGHTNGVFQLESPGMTDLVMKLYQDIDSISDENLEQCFERAVAGVALYRPGPMDYIPNYLENMKHPAEIKYDHPLLESILKPTYGVIVYQEQVMQIVQKLAGYTLGRADLVRKAMGKKKRYIIEAEKAVFIYGNADSKQENEALVPGCIKNGIEESVAEGIWNKMEKFAEYAFNKSHAAAYASIAVKTAWLATHYPLEFYTATLNSVLTKSDVLKSYIISIQKDGYKILPPSVNKSFSTFTIEYAKDESEESCIRFGFKGLKDINHTADAISIARGNEEFSDMQDLAERLGKNGGFDKRGYEALIYSGSTDCLPGTRKSKIGNVPLLTDESKFWNNLQNSPQISFFEIEDSFKTISNIDVSDPGEFDKQFLLKKEKEVAGFYISGNPLDEFISDLNKQNGMIDLSDVINVSPTKEFLTYGIINNSKVIFSGKGPISSFVLENSSSEIKGVCFSDQYSQYKHLINDEQIVVVKCRYQNSDDWGPQLIVSEVYDVKTYLESTICPKSIIVSIKNRQEQDLLFKIMGANLGKDVEIIISAKGKEYPPLKNKVAFSSKLVSTLQNNFGLIQPVYE